MPRDGGGIRKFFQTPKGLLIVILTAFILIAAPGEGWGIVLPGMAAAILTSALADAAILRVRTHEWQFPSGAILTAMIVAMVLSVQQPWFVVAAVSLFGVLTKYAVRTRMSNVFNPAAIAIVASYYVFHTGQSWWGALPTVNPVFLRAALPAGGIFITRRVNKLPMVIAFLGAFYLLFTITAYVGDESLVSEVYRAPDAYAAFYFATIILTDPPTSSAKGPDQVVYGIIAALVSYLFFIRLGVVYYLLAGVLAGNVYEAWRRVHRRSESRFPAGIGHFLREISPWRAKRLHHRRIERSQA
jgi:Na+-translocating ferredoxin:NAD+ oxidoreductase RnfD subunit